MQKRVGVRYEIPNFPVPISLNGFCGRNASCFLPSSWGMLVLYIGPLHSQQHRLHWESTEACSKMSHAGLQADIQCDSHAWRAWLAIAVVKKEEGHTQNALQVQAQSVEDRLQVHANYREPEEKPPPDQLCFFGHMYALPQNSISATGCLPLHHPWVGQPPWNCCHSCATGLFWMHGPEPPLTHS